MDTGEGRYLIGVDVGGTTAKIGIIDSWQMPTFVAKTAVPTRTENDGVHILPDIAEAISVLAEEAGISMEDVRGIGIGVPGPVMRAKDTGNYIVNRCVNLGWGVLDMSEELSELTGIDTIVALNDANAAALGEVICGTSRMMAESQGSYRDIIAVMVTIGTGIGGGVVLDGEVLDGAFGAGGEIGHMKIAPQHPLLDEINASYEKGTGRTPDMKLETFEDLEYYTSATGIARMARAALDAFPDDSSMREFVKEETNDDGEVRYDYSDVDAKVVFDAAKDGDKIALRVVEFFADTLGTGLAAVASVVDPDLFIIGGGVAAAGDLLLSGLKKAYKRTVFHASRETKFVLAVLGNDAGKIGAACSLL